MYIKIPAESTVRNALKTVLVIIPVTILSINVAALIPIPASASTLKSLIRKSSFFEKKRLAVSFIF